MISSENPRSKEQRLVSLDALRGLIMALMAVDHANYFIARSHPTGEFWGIPLPYYESSWAFLTRFLTQPCAPGFFFLMGASMILFAESRRKKGWTEIQILRHFLTRGLTLIFLQFFLENTAWLLGPASSFDPPGEGGQVWFQFGVLFALGAAMIIGSFLTRASSAIILILSFAFIAATQLLIPDATLSHYPFPPLIRILLIPGKTGHFQVFYSVIPWCGVTGLGLLFGRWLDQDERRAYRKGLIAGIFLLAAFIILRMANLGDFHEIENFGWMSFLNVTKYPPSPVFLALTLGINLVILFGFSRSKYLTRGWGNPLLVFGRTALFFYIVHLYLYGCVGFILAPQGSGLALMYIIWLLGLIVLYFICSVYSSFKKRKPLHSVWRFF